MPSRKREKEKRRAQKALDSMIIADDGVEMVDKTQTSAVSILRLFNNLSLERMQIRNSVAMAFYLVLPLEILHPNR